MPNLYARRDFLKIILKGASLLTLSSFASSDKFFSKANKLFAEPINSKTDLDLYIIEGTDYKKLIREGFNYLGGIKQFVKPDSYIVIKPNSAWSRTPEQAGNTHPDLVFETIRLCLDAGAKKVDVIENPCDNWKSCFKVSGISEAVQKAGGNMIHLTESGDFKEVTINGKILKNAMVANQIFKADCFINMPIAKSHSAATLTMCMKNHMGIVKDRGTFHMSGLHQCIADIASFVKPHLNILDCTRILLTNGPKGPGDVKILNKIVLGKDQVAVDSYGATLFGFKPHEIEYIKIADIMGIGLSDIRKLNILEKKLA